MPAENYEYQYAIEKFESALNRLRDAIEIAGSQLEKDGTIQRFEFTFEVMWKTIKRILQYKGIQAKTPRDCLQEAFQLNWIKNEDVYINMLIDRNNTSHIYDEKTANQIFQNIKERYYTSLHECLSYLKKSI